ncbi:DUF1643 domain-containing protein [Nonomuraea typhae]|uniref:DUF1643 domain-containing protein n=1 Tax=Nonomuraea typhae TaxID=2603600 RepID=UPI0012F95F5C
MAGELVVLAGNELGALNTRRTLCAILLNPALRPLESTTTFRNVRSALPVVSCNELVVANLLNIPTKDALALNRTKIDDQELREARALISPKLQQADVVILAWGVGGMSGQARLALQRQTAWLRDMLNRTNHDQVWTVTGRPRHPSRWRQYVGPEKRRVSGSCFEERLSMVMTPTRIDSEAGRLLFERAF